MEVVDLASQKGDHIDGVELAESSEPVAANGGSKKATLSLKQRMAAVRDECSSIYKDNIKMGNFTIKGHTFEAVLSEVRPLFAKHGIDMTPNLIGREYTGNRCDVLVDFTFERTDDSEEQRVIRWGGAGTDNGDKAFAKAGTNCVKEMLKKRFLITDREDAREAEEAVEHRTHDAVDRKELEAAKKNAQDSIVGWASTFKAAIEGAKDEKAVGRLQAENAGRLSSPDLPVVTRQFFEELLDRRKRELREK